MIDTGGHAYPTSEEVYLGNEGATLLDFFAAHALVGLLAQPDHTESGYPVGKWSGETYTGIAREAFALAEAMVLERKRMMS